ncbi:ATP-binding protein [Mesonia ostreae]|uniref:histidine kinase n=1 Tax=Mesonia ostreae TaxID=861110 RepID=A0ABU2KLU8_9FLAO|nr:ATP-binding protein [Mesonia ostreae]MDT0295697.1 ATP-binding protein [Mesonia ostreae]
MDKAEYYFNKSFENRLSSSAKGIQLASRNRIAQMHYLRNRFAEAQKEYTTVIEKAKGDLWELTFAYLGLAEVHLKNSKLDEALENAEKSYELANKMDAFWEKERSTELLSKIYKLQGNYQEANKYQEENANLKDTLFNIEQAEIIALMQLDIQEAENSALISKNQIAENNLLFNQILIFLIVIVLLITLFFVSKFRKIIIEKDQLNLILAEKNLQLTKIDKGKNKLFSIVSHDLRSPIASLTQIMDLLLQNAFSEEEKQEVYSEVRAQLDNSSRMLNNLLIWASTQLNGTKVNFTEVDVIAEMTEILNVYRISSRTKRVHITHNKHKDSLRIQVDKVQLHVILHNLLSNALKYTPKEKSIKISYQTKPEHIEIHIFNEGTPISKDQLDKFFSENNSSITSLKGTDGEFGTGLGLFLI